MKHFMVMKNCTLSGILPLKLLLVDDTAGCSRMSKALDMVRDSLSTILTQQLLRGMNAWKAFTHFMAMNREIMAVKLLQVSWYICALKI